jgi:hypothetical protein
MSVGPVHNQMRSFLVVPCSPSSWLRLGKPSISAAGVVE